MAVHSTQSVLRMVRLIIQVSREMVRKASWESVRREREASSYVSARHYSYS